MVGTVDRALPRAPTLVALGGGADSAVLAWAVLQTGRRVRAATVDHRLADSPLLIAAARALAAGLGLEHRVLPSAGAGTSEADLRLARHAALEAEAAPGEVIVTGHSGDDQAETVLGNLLRGAGAGGLSGIPDRRGRWHRPLLGFPRAALRAVADELGLPYADDPGNADPGRRRNVIRHEVIPLIEERLGPGAREALVRASALLAADDAELERRAAAVPVRGTPEGILLSAATLATLPAPVAARVVRRGLRLLLSPYPGHRSDVETVLAVAARRPGTTLPIQGGNLAVREGPWVALRAAAPPAPLPAADLPVPGEAHFGEWILRAEVPGPLLGPRPVGRRITLLDPVVAGGGLVVRAAVPGDRVDTGRGRQSVAEALRAARVPARRRSRWPVVEAGGTIAWVAGVRLAPWAAARGEEVVRIRLEEAR